MSIPVRTRGGVSGNYTIEVNGLDQVDHFDCVVMEDLVTGELYDLRDDPRCMSNRIGSPGAQASRKALSKRLDTWMQQQGDLGDPTERAAKSRQPKQRPWQKKDGYRRSP